MQMRCKSYMCLIYVWSVYGTCMASTVNPTTHLYGTYKGHILDLQRTYKSLPYIPYKPHLGETVVPGIYLVCDTMHVHNR